MPPGRWAATWVLAIALAIAGGALLERRLRARGYRPSVTDDKHLWSLYRARVSNDDPRTIALLGASRFQLGLSMPTLRDALPDHRIVQLAVDGTTPWATLEDLAADEDFRGLAVVSMFGNWFLPVTRERQRPWVDAYHQWAPGARMNRRLSTFFQSRLVTLGAGGRRLAGHLIGYRKLPRPPYAVMHADRSRSADYRLTNVKRRRAKRLQRLKRQLDKKGNHRRWRQAAEDVEPLVAAIQARGGNVVFVRMPTSDMQWEVENGQYPKAACWDWFAARTRAITVHFADYPELSAFELPDMSHLDQRDAPAFTAALVQILRDKGVF